MQKTLIENIGLNDIPSVLPNGGTSNQVLTKNSSTDFDTGWSTPVGSGDALTTNPLSQFASTTSSQLAGIISDETGTGSLVFANTPTFVTPVLGTPTSGNLTNCTFPTLNQNTTGSAASLSISGQGGLLSVIGLTVTNRIKTVRDAADTLLELGGSYTPTGTWTNMSLTTPSVTTSIKTPAITVPSDSTTAFQIFKADGATRVVDVDTTNARVGINKTPGAFDLDVNGAVNFASTLAVTGHVTLEGVTSTGASGSGLLLFQTNPTIDTGTLINQVRIGNSGDLAITRNAAGVLEVNNGTSGQWGQLKVGIRDAQTTVLSNAFTIGHQSTGTPAANFGTSFIINADNNGAADVQAAKISAAWSTATNLSQTSYLDFILANVGLNGSKMRLSGAGGLSVGATVDPGAGVINANTGFQIANAATAQTVLASNGTNFVATNIGAWDGIVRVTGSDATTTGQSLVDITGLVTPTLSNSTQYEIEAVLFCNTTAVTTGTEYGIHGAGTGSAATCNAMISGALTSSTGANLPIIAVDTATAAFLTTSAQNGAIIIKGFVTTTSTGTSTISIQHLKVTSGTSTVKIGSILKWRKA